MKDPMYCDGEVASSPRSVRPMTPGLRSQHKRQVQGASTCFATIQRLSAHIRSNLNRSASQMTVGSIESSHAHTITCDDQLPLSVVYAVVPAGHILLFIYTPASQPQTSLHNHMFTYRHLPRRGCTHRCMQDVNLTAFHRCMQAVNLTAHAIATQPCHLTVESTTSL